VSSRRTGLNLFFHLWSGKQRYLSEGHFGARTATAPQADPAPASIGRGGGLVSFWGAAINAQSRPSILPF
jgi:hypothetical protein